LPAQSTPYAAWSTNSPRWARFPVAHPQPTDINEIIDSALSMFNGRLDGIVLHRALATDLPKGDGGQ